MQDSNFNPCEMCLSYLTGDGTPKERRQFEQHLQICPSCRQQMNEFQEVWDVLPWQMELIEAPADLKAVVMDQIDKFDATRPPLIIKKKKRITRSYAIAAAAALLFLTGTIWNIVLYRERTAVVEQSDAQPAAVEKVYALNAVAASSSATGKACILKQGSETKLVVYLYGMSETKGNEAYQVWLIHDGKRTNAGTFHVSDNGLGVLTYKISDKDEKFQAIGITLEPDSDGTEPRGKKVLGT